MRGKKKNQAWTDKTKIGGGTLESSSGEKSIEQRKSGLGGRSEQNEAEKKISGLRTRFQATGALRTRSRKR
jgi:Tfp pilus assembly major pilin PilA